MSVHHLGRRARVGLLVALLTVVATACPPTTGGTTTTTTSTTPTTLPGGVNTPPTITAFSAVRATAPSPLTTAFQWTIVDPDPQSLTCGLDLDDNGVYEVTVPACTSASLRSATFSTVGTSTVNLVVSDGIDAVTSSTTVTVTAASADSFEITVRLNGTMTPSQQAAFTTAAARWSQVIRTGLANSSLNLPANDCGTGAPAFNGAIDDVVIDAAIAPIDGVGAILGQAGPCYVRITGGLPLYGVMSFDDADVAQLESSGQLNAVILHEMGHVLGFGTVWGTNVLTGAGTSNPVFTGPVARGAWQALGRTGPVPVENSGGQGTVDSHWRESVFNAELMTGYIDNGANPMSAVTIGSLADLGYGVDLGAAEAYGLPALRADTGDVDRQLEVRLITPRGAR